MRDETAGTSSPGSTCRRYCSWGGEDAFAGVEKARAIAERVRDARLVVLDNCGHLPTLEQSETWVPSVPALPHRRQYRPLALVIAAGHNPGVPGGAATRLPFETVRVEW